MSKSVKNLSVTTAEVLTFIDYLDNVSYHLYLKGPRGGRYLYFTLDKAMADKARKHVRKPVKASFTVGKYAGGVDAYHIDNLVFA